MNGMQRGWSIGQAAPVFATPQEQSAYTQGARDGLGEGVALGMALSTGGALLFAVVYALVGRTRR